LTTLLRILIPSSIMIFLVYRLRKYPLAVCGIPLTLVLGEGAFMRTWEFSLHLPLFPLPLNWQDVVFGTFVIAWLFIIQKRSEFRSLHWGPDMIAIFILLALIIWQVPQAWIIDDKVTLGTIFAVRNYAYFPLGVLLWVDILRRSTRIEFEQLLSALALVTIPFAGLYALSSVGIPIFPDLSWSPISIGSAIIVRDFLTFPYYIKLSLAYFLTRTRQNLWNLGAIGILTAGIFLSYTRSWIISAGFLIIIGIATPVIMKGQFGKVISRVIIIGIGLFLALELLMNAFPENITFSFSRLQEIQQQGLQTGNVQVRLNSFSQVSLYIKSVDPIFGVGASVTYNKAIDPNSTFGAWQDQLWAVILYHMGWSGLVAVGLILLTFLLSASQAVWTGRNQDQSWLPMVLFMVLVWEVARSFVSSEAMTYYQVGATLFLGGIMVEKRSLWVENPITEPGLPMLEPFRQDWFIRRDRYTWLRRMLLVLILTSIAVITSLYLSR
jgi:hypothetical protein